MKDGPYKPTRGKRSRLLDPGVVEMIVSLRNSGMSITDVAKQVRVNRETLKKFLSHEDTIRFRNGLAREELQSLHGDAIAAIRGQLRAGDGSLGLKTLEASGVAGKQAISIQVNAQNAQVNLNQDQIEAAREAIKVLREANENGERGWDKTGMSVSTSLSLEEKQFQSQHPSEGSSGSKSDPSDSAPSGIESLSVKTSSGPAMSVPGVTEPESNTVPTAPEVENPV